jgi:hypothetical protein
VSRIAATGAPLCAGGNEHRANYGSWRSEGAR